MAAAAERTLTIEEYLEQSGSQDLVRFTTAGSVDDGKSTLIGRLLYDAKGLFVDQLAAIQASRVNRSTGPIDFSLLTDGLRAEREQGITIDVAYRHFRTPRRKFIIADTPGHEQYTRNMATGASTADVAVILIDARHGVLPQSRRHAYITTLLGIPQIAVAVNKMDLVGWSEERFHEIQSEFTQFLKQLGAPAATFIPVSALDGDNVARRGAHSPWFQGPALLEYLETVPLAAEAAAGEFRFPVQYVNRPSLHFRGFAGQIASGEVRRGDVVIALPSGRTSRVAEIVTYDGSLEVAHAPASITLRLEDEIDVSRGDLLAAPGALPHVGRRLEATVVWMADAPLQTGGRYLVKHTTQQTSATVARLLRRVNVNTLAEEPAEALGLNEIGVVELETARPLFFDAYQRNRRTGAFILIDPLTNATVGAGMILEPKRPPAGFAEAKRALGAVEHNSARVSPAERYVRLGHLPATIWLTARVDLAHLLERRLFDLGCQTEVLAEQFDSGILPELAAVLRDAGVIAICSVAEPMEDEGARARQLVGDALFVDFAPDQLPANDEEAARAILNELEARRVIRAGQFLSGEGI